MNDLLEIFNSQLAELINSSQLPASAIRLSLQNNIFQLDILKLTQLLNNKENENIEKKEQETENQ